MEGQNGWKLLYYLLFGFCLVQGGKKQRTTFDDELFQSHAHMTFVHTRFNWDSGRCACVCACVDTGH